MYKLYNNILKKQEVSISWLPFHYEEFTECCFAWPLKMIQQFRKLRETKADTYFYTSVLCSPLSRSKSYKIFNN